VVWRNGPRSECGGTQNISVKQTVDLVKLGVNYKFDWAAAPIVAKD
jgi:hypothetical protein